MSASTIRRIIISFVVTSGLVWAGYEFVYKGTITVTADAQATITITTPSGQAVTSGKSGVYRLLPGSYVVTISTASSGTAKHINVGSLTNTTVQASTTATLPVSLLAKAALYGPLPGNNSVIGYDPSDNHLKRVDRAGNLSTVISSDALAGQEQSEAEISSPIDSYQPYQHNQMLVASGAQLEVVGSSVASIRTDGIIIDPNDRGEHHFIIASQPSLASFVVAYKQDVFWYENTSSAPKKIYTAKKAFDSVVYAKDVIGLYDTSIPPSKEDLRSVFNGHQIDLLLVNTSSGQEQTITGPIASATLSPDGNMATVAIRNQQPYIFDIQKKQKTTDIIAPLTAGPYWTDTTTYLYSTGRQLWQYDTAKQISTLVSELPNTVTSFYKEDAGSILVTTYNMATDASIYRLGGGVTDQSLVQKLSSALPYSTADLKITYSSITGTPTIIVETLAALNDASQLPQYQQETLRLRQVALDYLKNAGIDPATVTITYDPADPL